MARMNYSSQRWKEKRMKILRRDKYMDRIEARYGRAVEATIVHHIYPSEDYPEYAYEDWNLISVSNKTHAALHLPNSGQLSDKGKELMEKTRAPRKEKK